MSVKLTYQESALSKKVIFVARGIREKKGSGEKKVLDYYPFGAAMPGRHESRNQQYKYGFNGMEADNELKGNKNHYTTYWRQYDPRLGRWMSTEPKPVAWESMYVAFRNNPIYYADPNGDWVKGAGFFKNVFNSDAKINAQNRAAETGGTAFKDGNGWTVNYQTQGPDLGNGAITLPTNNVEHFGNKPGLGSKFANWWNKSDLYFNASGKVDVGVQAGFDVRVNGAAVELEGSLFTVDLIGIKAQQVGNENAPWNYDFDYVGEDGYMKVSQYAGASLIGGANYTHSFDGKISGGYRNEKHTTKIKTIGAEYVNERVVESSATNHELKFILGARLTFLLGVEGEVSFGVKDK